MCPKTVEDAVLQMSEKELERTTHINVGTLAHPFVVILTFTHHRFFKPTPHTSPLPAGPKQAVNSGHCVQVRRSWPPFPNHRRHLHHHRHRQHPIALEPHAHPTRNHHTHAHRAAAHHRLPTHDTRRPGVQCNRMHTSTRDVVARSQPSQVTVNSARNELFALLR